MPVKVIKAKAHTTQNDPYRSKLRVAAYCRVSTDEEAQESSFEVQQSYFQKLIEGNPDWELVKIYADQGISGTSLRKRVEFNQMIQDCRDGKIDLVLTKSISRFARNTVDCLNVIRELKGLNIPIMFHKENINTLSAAGEVLITIMASLAQAESESISKNVKLGIQYRFKQGQRIDNPRNMLGYAEDEEGRCVIDEEQAAIVRRIYREFLDGKTLGQIGHGLRKDGIKSNRGSMSWAPSNIRYILENEKYAGHVLLQKYYKKDVLAHRCDINDGSVPQYLSENCHEAIIPQFIFNLVQEKLARLDMDRAAGKLRRTRNNNGLFGIVRCGTEAVAATDAGAATTASATEDGAATATAPGAAEDGAANVVDDCGSTGITYQHISANDTWHCYKGSKDECNRRIVRGSTIYSAVRQAVESISAAELEVMLEEGDVEAFLIPHVGETWEPSEAGEKLLRQHNIRSLLQVAGVEVDSLHQGVDVATSLPEVDEFYKATKPVDTCIEGLIMRFVDGVIISKSGITVQFRAGVEVQVPSQG